MTANAAFAAALTTFLIVAWTAGELAFLAPFKGLLFHRHGWVIGGAILFTGGALGLGSLLTRA